ncbi:MAG TPA: phosphatidylserine decarboxylase family protein [Candidatus Rifleibacterium sp.]|nr:phosphatidylserine decarboxylase family protein [Candidatus Rifleibacterium sp.]HPW58734.1 phosphatidylserine decarboxylase family protein [Candidatus Rifleibacterium sp.]
MRSPIHREGFFMAGSLLVLAMVFSTISRWLGRIFYLATAFTLYFFRDPERQIPEGDCLIVSPADGKVVGIDSVEHVPFLDGPAKRVSIFLSVFDVHINRSPIKGKIAYRHYSPGEFLAAFEPKASVKNEQNAVGIEDADGYRVLVKQIAGLIARRILCWKNPGDQVGAGERFGLIRFGSRTEIYMPLDARIEVRLGQRVQGGSSVIARRC